MQISFPKLQELLLAPAPQLAPVYVVLGDDIYLINASIKLLRAAAPTKERSRYDINSSTDWERCQEWLANKPMFTGPRLLELYVNTPLTTELGTYLLTYIRNIMVDDLLVIVGQAPSPKLKQTPWYRQLLTQCSVVSLAALWPQEEQQILIRQARSYGLTMAPQVLAYFADNVAANVGVGLQALEQMHHANLPEISCTTIDTLIGDQAKFTGFDLFWASCQGQDKQIMRIINHLKREQEILLVLGAMVYGLRLLTQVALQLHYHHATWAQCCLSYHINKSRQAAAQRFLAQHKIADCYKLLSYAASVEQRIKLSADEHSWDAILRLCLGISNNVLATRWLYS